jgi:hypothetical protein
MDRRLATRNIRMALLIGAFSVFMLGLSFVAAEIWIG